MDVGHNGHEGIELYALNPRFPQRFVIPCPNFTHTTDIVVHNAHFHAVLYLGFKNVERLIPHFTARQNKVFEKNIPLGML